MTTDQLPGRAAEELVANALAAQGWEILGRNVRLGRLELDIVARDGRVVVVVEVRSRSPEAFTTAFSSLDPLKRLRTRRAGERLWNRKFRDDPSVDRLRFDEASVGYGPSGPTLEYVRAAF